MKPEGKIHLMFMFHGARRLSFVEPAAGRASFSLGEKVPRSGG